MSSDLAQLYRELESEKQTPDVKKIRKNIHDKLSNKLREHFLELLEIGGIIGYGKLETELSKAADLVGKLKKTKKS
jgi:hypothetical protein